MLMFGAFLNIMFSFIEDEYVSQPVPLHTCRGILNVLNYLKASHIPSHLFSVNVPGITSHNVRVLQALKLS